MFNHAHRKQSLLIDISARTEARTIELVSTYDARLPFEDEIPTAQHSGRARSRSSFNAAFHHNVNVRLAASISAICTHVIGISCIIEICMLSCEPELGAWTGW